MFDIELNWSQSLIIFYHFVEASVQHVCKTIWRHDTHYPPHSWGHIGRNIGILEHQASSPQCHISTWVCLAFAFSEIFSALDFYHSPFLIILMVCSGQHQARLMRESLLWFIAPSRFLYFFIFFKHLKEYSTYV